MTVEIKDMRLDGVYAQRQKDFLMQRVKLPAGVISSIQARVVAAIADRFGQGTIHLTTRCSMELHWLREPDLPEIKRQLTSVGLTSRGACGGAVRGVSCGSPPDAEGFPQIEALARRLQRHFAGNPRFERLPKKFKIGIHAGTASKRHLIQDVGLVLTVTDNGATSYDVYLAGGLGREPHAGFLFSRALPEERIIPLIEAVLRVYAAGAAPGKRLKHLLQNLGEEGIRQLIAAEPGVDEQLPPLSGLTETLLPQGSTSALLQAGVFAGELNSATLRNLADFADAWAGGTMTVTAEQNVAFRLAADSDRQQAGAALAAAGFPGIERSERVLMRVCPGNHECRMGLAPTRDIAREVVAVLGEPGERISWAISGCQNSCSQPQLAEVGIVSARLATEAEKSPRFDLYRGTADGLGRKAAEGLNLAELLSEVKRVCATAENQPGTQTQ